MRSRAQFSSCMGSTQYIHTYYIKNIQTQRAHNNDNIGNVICVTKVWDMHVKYDMYEHSQSPSRCSGCAQDALASTSTTTENRQLGNY